MNTLPLTQRNISQGMIRKSMTTSASSHTRARNITQAATKNTLYRPSRRQIGVTGSKIIESRQVIITRSILGLFAVSLCLYLYMVVSIIIATVDRKSLEESVRLATTELSAVESEYSSKIGSVTLADVKKSGYIDAGSTIFATRENAPTLTLRNE